MKTSFTLIILNIIFTSCTSSNIYRLIIIDNGFQANESKSLLNSDIKQFSSLLFKIPKEEYKNPSQKQNFEEITEIPEYTGFMNYFQDELSWKFISSKSSKVKFKLFSGNAYEKFCYPTESFKVIQNFFGEIREYKVDNSENFKTFDNGSIFSPFLGFFSQENVGENTGFSVNMASTQFSFLKNVYYIEDFESEMEDIQISEFSVSKSTHVIIVNWEDINVEIKIEEGSSGEDLSKYSNKPLLKDDGNKFRLRFVHKSGFHFAFENTNGIVLRSNGNRRDNANSIIYCEIILDGFKRYFYKTEIPARSVNEDIEWKENEVKIEDDGSLQRVADKCFNYGMDAQNNSNSDVFNRRIKYYNYYGQRNLVTDLNVPFVEDGKTIKLDRINQILFVVNFVSFFEEDEEKII